MTTKSTTKTATVDTKELREAFQKANFIGSRQTLPVLYYALAEFQNGKAFITTTDLERTIRIEIDSSNTEVFSTLLPKKATGKFLVGNNGNATIAQRSPITIALSRNGIGELNLTVPIASDYPPMPKLPDNLEWHSIDGKWFCSMFRIVSTACATEDSRPILTGVCCNDGKIASADGFRLYAFRDERLAFGLADKQAIVPLKTILLTDRLFNKSETIEIAFEYKEELTGLEKKILPNRVYFKSGNVILSSQLIQGTFPKYEQLIPSNFLCKASFSAPLLAQRLNMIDADNIGSGIVRYNFETLEQGEQVCSLSSAFEDDAGKYQLSCPVKIEGFNTKARIAFQHKYMVEAIKPFSMCNLEITSESQPGKLTGDIEGLIIVIMPMYVQW